MNDPKAKYGHTECAGCDNQVRIVKLHGRLTTHHAALVPSNKAGMKMTYNYCSGKCRTENAPQGSKFVGSEDAKIHNSFARIMARANRDEVLSPAPKTGFWGHVFRMMTAK